MRLLPTLVGRNRFVDRRIKRFTNDADHSHIVPFHNARKLSLDCGDSLAEPRSPLFFWHDRNRALEIVNHWKDRSDHILGGRIALTKSFLVDPAPKVLKFRNAPLQLIEQTIALRSQR